MSETLHAQVVLSGQAGQQVVNNILYYRFVAELTDPETLADTINTSLLSAFVPVWLNCMSVHYTLNELKTQIFTSAWFPLLFLPHPTLVNDAGNVAGNLAGPAQCAIIKFILDPVTALVPAGGKRMKRSYLAMGPIPETSVQDTGEFDGTPYPAGALTALLGSLASEIDTGGTPGTIVNERAGVPGTAGERTSMLIVSAAFRALASFRRSRLT